MPLLPLASDEVHVWYAKPEQLDTADLRAWAHSILDPNERTAIERLMFPEDRLSHLASCALRRVSLSRYAPRAPSHWRFVRNAHGRPEIHGDRLSLRFNTAHTRGLVACAVGRDSELGVDVERCDREAPLAIASRYFAPAEANALLALEPAQRAHRFFEYWTLKESYVKARGLGLSLPLDRCAFDFDSSTPRLACDTSDGPADAWQFVQFGPVADCLGAVCVRRQPGEAKRITIREARLSEAFATREPALRC